MAEVYSWYEQIRGVKMDFWVLVGLHQCLNWPTHGSFAVVFYLRIEWWIIVIISINTVARWFQDYVNKSMWRLQLIEFRLHLGFCTYIYKLINWLVRCDLNINHWINHLLSCRWLKLSWYWTNARIIPNVATF